MCGLFGYFGKMPISSNEVMNILADLEKAQLPVEKTTVGGDGAGIAILKDPVQCIKCGFKGESPVKVLFSSMSEQKIRRVMAHVRQASPDFKSTIGFSECTQPYQLRFPGGELVSIHNGLVSNYEKLKAALKKEHNFESESARIIDSEVIPHHFRELLDAHGNVEAATAALYDAIEGPGNALAMWLRKNDKQHLILLYKGKARGLYMWEDANGDILFCSRRGPVEKYLGRLIRERAFGLSIEIEPQTESFYKRNIRFD